MRRSLLAGLLTAAAALAAPWLPSAPTSSTAASAAPAPSPGRSAKPETRFATLPSRAPLGEPRGALFATPAPAPKRALTVPLPAEPAAPPMPYRVAGRVAHDGVSKVVLVKGELALPVQEGDMLDGGYRVDAVGTDDVTLLYLPLAIRERLAFAPRAALAAPAAPAVSLQAARLRWEGPARVRGENSFNLVLKLTASEPLRASPLQLSYDAELLEALDVRPGKLFASGASFSYRIGPPGSISIGASGPGAAAADAELVIVTFKPLRAAEATEVRISSLELQGMAGKPIAVEPAAAFRTSITP